MTYHFTILPTDVVEFVSASLSAEDSQVNKRPLRVFRLPHPRTSLPSLFLPFESSGADGEEISKILEIQAVSPPEERSWMLGKRVIADGKLLTMTPIDPAFLLLPIMQAIQPLDGSTLQFRTADDLFEEAANIFGKPPAVDSSSTETNDTFILAQDIIDLWSLKCMRKAVRSICDVKNIAADIVVYRFSPSKINEYLRTKVAHLEKCAALESRTIVRELAKDGLMEDGQEDLLRLGRIRSCCDLLAQYLPPDIRSKLLASYDLSRLNKYLGANKEEALKVATVAPAKTQAKEDDKAKGVEKKRKGAKISQGVEKLKKVDTTGMAKLSSFFNKG
ncbi:hypothetical protein BYT27DRAFT_7180561 [Phlegmacium glaucopus]|nr:hypothetical protein BYT27DRAFT_7180561 [Phlegmacium glaucopus]